MLSFSAKTVTKELLADLPERSRRVLTDRFGLSNKGESRTLDAIGQEYGITRERIRQIENHGLTTVRESGVYVSHGATWDDLKRAIFALGGAVAEETVLAELAKNESERNHIVFLLTVGHHFSDRREDNDFRARWHIDESLVESVEEALTSLYESIEQNRLMSEEEFIQLFAKHLKQSGVKPRPVEVMTRWLLISKRVGKNPLGEWGRTESPHVRIKNTRDFAYLTLKRHGSPMHFTEVAKGISKLFNRETHPATTHNELIKDSRFVLVGRGLYALKEWGYEPGVVRDVIKGILTHEGPLSREEIIDRVKRERYVKDATIVVNLQSALFARLPDGRYALAK
ncbi:MAG: RNA polymerase sigma factor [Candidatus Kaiserbacteria bacterium GW2011_GWB1_52_6]|uniref:RNA polymerase sigma factor n=2 Tax=Candidatus Kaiseribacteriota TaxID=1752734 RepID=A0A0G1XB02_9BACT|nr:MAG: RNA polymerase sigma factor [Candidatus Kaiserbacteria bacterium GW2011_GWA2_52_12]KKW28030.1 MAG: RNA polymerase sigma factor [Candidatus Kaiserbacteria bacterium GW2011_GWB1_52_6]